uniref:Uncharacterized protein n=1 Tax=Anguilla anguilla TaxID=7936 RepID=A0A0E9V7K2_ANGAN
MASRGKMPLLYCSGQTDLNQTDPNEMLSR